IDIVVMKRDTERPTKAIGENNPLLRAAGVVRVAKNDDLIGTGVRQENVAIGSDGQKSGPLKILGKDIDAKTLGYGGKETVGHAHFVRSVVRGPGRKGCRKIGLLAMRDLSWQICR